MNSNRRSIRLPGYDYASAGWYFVTICCHKRQNLFGEIRQGEMALNAAGEMVEECWFNIPKHFPNTVLHEFVVMPNHFHAIIGLNGKRGTDDLALQSGMEGVSSTADRCDTPLRLGQHVDSVLS